MNNPINPDQYYLFTVDSNQKLYYHVIDMSMQGNPGAFMNGDVISKNNLLDGDNNYGNHLALLQDESELYSSVLYATTYSGNTTSIVGFEIGQEGIEDPVALAIVPSMDEVGEGELQISPDATKLAIYSPGTESGFFGHKKATVYEFDLTPDHLSLANPIVIDSSLINIGDGHLAYSTMGNNLYYGENGLAVPAEKTWLYSKVKDTAEIVLYTTGEINRGIDNKMYVGGVYDTTLTYLDENACGTVDSGAQLLAGMGVGAILPYQPHRILSGEKVEGLFARTMDLKDYEMSDHLGNVRVTVSDRKLSTIEGNATTNFTASLSSLNNYYSFGSLQPGRSFASSNYRFGFNGQEKDDNFHNQVGSVYDFLFRIYDARVARFLSTDPLEGEYPWNSPYAFAENRVIDGRDLEGKEWENFMSSFKSPGELKVKLPNAETAQRQNYSVTVANSKMSFADFKKNFKSSPQDYLTNSKAEFNSPVDGEGKPSQFKVGSYIKIDIAGPMNNSYVMVKALSEDKDGSLSATFVTLEGHVEKGIINFTISQDKDGNTKFQIDSQSEVDYGMVPDAVARDQQSKSWKEVLTRVVAKLGGEEKSRDVDTEDPVETKK